MEKDYLYSLWTSIKSRCYSASNPNYQFYGARNINIHTSWMLSYDTFRRELLAEIGHRPTKKHSIDRINNSGNYEPDNLKWSTSREQSNNRRTNTLISIDNRTQTLTEWCRELRLNRPTVSSRLRRGWQVERALRQR